MISAYFYNSDTPVREDGRPWLSSRRRRKGPVFKLDSAVLQRLEEESDQTEQFEHVEIVQPQSPLEAGFDFESFQLRNSQRSRNRSLDPAGSAGYNSGRRLPYSCKFCGISFGDLDMFELHCSFHSNFDPFTCTCGHAAANRVDFYRHIAQVAHF